MQGVSWRSHLASDGEEGLADGCLWGGRHAGTCCGRSLAHAGHGWTVGHHRGHAWQTGSDIRKQTLVYYHVLQEVTSESRHWYITMNYRK